MGLQEMLDEMVKKSRTEKLGTSPQVTLGGLITQLDAVQDKTKQVYFEFSGLRPTGLNSWRGIYAELALSYDDDTKAMTVAELIELLSGAIGKTFAGYKGGNYVMGKGTPVWVDNYGKSNHTAVVGVGEGEYIVTLKTSTCEPY